MKKIILHIDMDAFFAAVEQRENKELQGKPVIIGGDSKRGVVSTCSYEARKYGVHSAMPIFMAKQKCPDGIYIYPNMKLYKKVSHDIFKIVEKYADKIEKLSIDEAFIDISHYGKDYEKVGMKIKKEIKSQIGIVASVGISYNKFLAKLASDWEKPDGFKVIKKAEVPEILLPLDIKEVFGLGKVSVTKLKKLGINTIEDLMKWPLDYMKLQLGKGGEDIYYLIRGIDDREVETRKEAKSYGRENTLKKDTKNKEELKKYLNENAIDISYALRVKELYGRTITLKVKTKDFVSYTRSKTLEKAIQMRKDIYEEGCQLLDEFELKEEVRLIGLTMSNITDGSNEQISFI